MTAAYTIVQGDTLPVFTVTLTVDGAALDLTSSVATLVVDSDLGVYAGSYALTLSATPTDGTASRTFTASETSALAAGSYRYAVRVVWGTVVRTVAAEQRLVVQSTRIH